MGALSGVGSGAAAAAVQAASDSNQAAKIKAIQDQADAEAEAQEKVDGKGTDAEKNMGTYSVTSGKVSVGSQIKMSVDKEERAIVNNQKGLGRIIDKCQDQLKRMGHTSLGCSKALREKRRRNHKAIKQIRKAKKNIRDHMKRVCGNGKDCGRKMSRKELNKALNKPVQKYKQPENFQQQSQSQSHRGGGFKASSLNNQFKQSSQQSTDSGFNLDVALPSDIDSASDPQIEAYGVSGESMGSSNSHSRSVRNNVGGPASEDDTDKQSASVYDSELLPPAADPMADPTGLTPRPKASVVYKTNKGVVAAIRLRRGSASSGNQAAASGVGSQGEFVQEDDRKKKLQKATVAGESFGEFEAGADKRKNGSDNDEKGRRHRAQKGSVGKIKEIAGKNSKRKNGQRQKDKKTMASVDPKSKKPQMTVEQKKKLKQKREREAAEAEYQKYVNDSGSFGGLSLKAAFTAARSWLFGADKEKKFAKAKLAKKRKASGLEDPESILDRTSGDLALSHAGVTERNVSIFNSVCSSYSLIQKESKINGVGQIWCPAK